MIDHEQSRWHLREGMTVLGADGGKIGQVVGVQATFFIVEKGWLFPTDYYIPADAINRVDADTVHLTVPKDEALHQGWDVLPVDEAEALHRDAAAAGTTLGGYTAEMGKMVADVDVKPTDIAAALEHPSPSPVVAEEVAAALVASRDVSAESAARVATGETAESDTAVANAETSPNVDPSGSAEPAPTQIEGSAEPPGPPAGPPPPESETGQAVPESAALGVPNSEGPSKSDAASMSEGAGNNPEKPIDDSTSTEVSSPSPKPQSGSGKG